MEGRLKELLWLAGGEWVVSFTTRENPSQIFNDLKDAPVNIEIQKAQKHRSMEANRYAWVLIDQIAAKTKLKASEVYRNAIRDIGGVSSTGYMKTEAVPVFREIWEHGHMGNQVEVIDEDGTGWSMIRIYHGSSTYNTLQMSLLLESLIQDAEALGIPTITPKEEERMLGKWAKKKHEQVDPAAG